MFTLLLKTDDDVFEQIKAFLSLLPKEKVEVIDPFDIEAVDDAEQQEIEAILSDPDTKALAEDSKRSYSL